MLSLHNLLLRSSSTKFWKINKLCLLNTFPASHDFFRLISNLLMFYVAYITNNGARSDCAQQKTNLGTVWSGFILFASIINLVWSALEFMQQTWRNADIFMTKTNGWIILFVWSFTFRSILFQLHVCQEGSSWVEPVPSKDKCVLLKDTMQWSRWGSNLQPLGLESNTTTEPLISFAQESSKRLSVCFHAICLNEMVLLSTQNICTKLGERKYYHFSSHFFLNLLIDHTFHLFLSYSFSCHPQFFSSPPGPQPLLVSGRPWNDQT